MWGMSQLVEDLLASREGLGSMELFPLMIETCFALVIHFLFKWDFCLNSTETVSPNKLFVLKYGFCVKLLNSFHKFLFLHFFSDLHW